MEEDQIIIPKVFQKLQSKTGIQFEPLNSGALTDPDSKRLIGKYLQVQGFTDHNLKAKTQLSSGFSNKPEQIPEQSHAPPIAQPAYTGYSNPGSAYLAAVPGYVPAAQPYQQIHPQAIAQPVSNQVKEILTPGFICSMGFLALVVSFILGGGFSPKPVEQQQVEILKQQQKDYAELTLAYAESNKRNVCIFAIGCASKSPAGDLAPTQAASQATTTTYDAQAQPPAEVYVQTWLSQGRTREEIKRFADWQKQNQDPKYPSADAVLAAL